MRGLAAPAIASLLVLAPSPAPSPTVAPTRRPGPTFCAEWIRQTKLGYERLTLFTDRELVWKTSDGSGEQVRRKTISPEETAFYCDYFARAEFWALPADLRSGMSGDFGTSRVTLTRADGSRKAIRFDELSSFSPEASSLKASLQGLRNLFTAKLAPATSFTSETLPPGRVLRRFDGVSFKVVRVLPDKDVVELEGTTDPILYYLRLSEMRFQFEAPQ